VRLVDTGSRLTIEPYFRLLTDTAFKQQKMRVWRPILSPRVAIATFLASGLLFVPIGVVLAAVTNQVCASRTRPPGLVASRRRSCRERPCVVHLQVVELESVDYAALCTTNPCFMNVTVTEKMVRPARDANLVGQPRPSPASPRLATFTPFSCNPSTSCPRGRWLRSTSITSSPASSRTTATM
jgi:hypothetical protein